jgi:hypothetical protein
MNRARPKIASKHLDAHKGLIYLLFFILQRSSFRFLVPRVGIRLEEYLDVRDAIDERVNSLLAI